MQLKKSCITIYTYQFVRIHLLPISDNIIVKCEDAFPSVSSNALTLIATDLLGSSFSLLLLSQGEGHIHAESSNGTDEESGDGELHGEISLFDG
jgi:hypothetical protein